MRRAGLWRCVARLALVAVAGLLGACAAHEPMIGRHVPEYPPAAAAGSGTWTLGLDEELWVIPRGAAAGVQAAGPGSGTLVARRALKADAELPIQKMDVHGVIQGPMATVEVAQKFENPFAERIEAIYEFPLPPDAGVSDFVMTVGERKIRGIIRERAEAEKIYQEAKRQGYRASLLRQEQPNVFRQSVANIEPGKAIGVTIRYFYTPAYADGWCEFAFPLKAGVRQASEAPGPDGRGPGYEATLALDIDAGVEIERIACNHRVDVERVGNSAQRARVTLAASERTTDRDFMLHYKVAGRSVQSGLMVQGDARGGYFALMLYPTEEIETLPRRPLDVVFVLDFSESLRNGWLNAAQVGVKLALQQLKAEDRFNIVSVTGGVARMAETPLGVSAANIAAAERYVDSLRAGGKSGAIAGIRAALEIPHDPARMRVLAVVTDGAGLSEAEISKSLGTRLGETRLLAYTVGPAPKWPLLACLARAGHGAVIIEGALGKTTGMLGPHLEALSHAALTNVRVDFGSMKVEGVLPARMPDLLPGRPVVVVGRFTGPADAVVVSGETGGERRSWRVTARETQAGAELGRFWARRQLTDCFERASYEEAPAGGWEAMMKRIALEHGLVSPFTGFVVVDASARTAGEQGTTVGVPVPVPEGVRYDTTVKDK